MKLSVDLSPSEVSKYKKVFDILLKKYNLRIIEIKEIKNKYELQKRYIEKDEYVSICEKFLFVLDKEIKISVEFVEVNYTLSCLYSFDKKYFKDVNKLFTDMIEIFNRVDETTIGTMNDFIKRLGEHIEINFKVEYLSLFLPAIKKTLDNIFKDFEKITECSFNQSSVENIRIEIRPNVFTYAELNKYTIYKEKDFMFAIGIVKNTKDINDFISAHTVTIYEVKGITSIKYLDKLQKLFDSRFEKKYRHYIPKGIKLTGSFNFLKIDKKLTFDDIVLEDNVKATIKKEVFDFFKKRELYKRSGIAFKRGIVLYGPPGTGKTTVAKIIASATNVSLFWVQASDLITSGSIDTIFKIARLVSPSVIIFEDIDFYAKDRDLLSGSGMEIASLMANLDGLENNDGLCVIFTTNRLKVVEKALVNRPGRIDVKIKLDSLKKTLLVKLLKKKFKKFEMENQDISRLIPNALRLTGAETVELATNIINYAKIKAEKDAEIIIKDEYILKALKTRKLLQEGKIVGFIDAVIYEEI